VDGSGSVLKARETLYTSLGRLHAHEIRRLHAHKMTYKDYTCIHKRTVERRVEVLG